ncbi:MAG: helix-turn-helix transcriptional regulator [Actinobacteria bacterium]|nr:helix-turn-helix transcriptional regulator [Actinomycetota bacterium]
MASLRPPSTRFAANLRRLRAEAGYSQEEVAFRSAVHRTQVSLLETGERMPRVLTLVCLAGALGVTPDDLLDGITWEPIVSVTGGLTVSPPEGDAEDV